MLGIGGERVSDSERAALAEIAGALGTEPPAEASGAAATRARGPSRYLPTALTTSACGKSRMSPESSP